MYESFGAKVDQRAKTVTFQVFFPDNSLDASQYQRGGLPHIAQMKVVGDFQNQIGGQNWDVASAPILSKTLYQNKGWLYLYTTPQPLADNFYQYKYFVTFENGETRYVSDPCTKYGGSDDQENSAFVVGGPLLIDGVQPLEQRLQPRDLVLYELMIDDFTAEYRGTRAPIGAIREKLDYLQELGINGIEFMPWTAWPGGEFSWGYNPFQFFSVTYRYVHDQNDPTNKLYQLKQLIDDMHQRKMQVILDGVFEDVNTGDQSSRGFPYRWFYQNPEDSPYVGSQGQFFANLDYGNNCTEEFIRDVCLYWIEFWQIDGIRFDYARGYLHHDDQTYGVAKIVGDLAARASATGRTNMAFMLEDLTDNRYDAIDDTNHTTASGCWFDPFWSNTTSYVSGSQLNGQLLRILNSNLDFALDKSPVIYIENHDHSTLVNDAGGRDRWYKVQAPAIALLTSPGIVLIHNGQEFGEDYFIPEDPDPGRIAPRPLRWQQHASDTSGQSLYRLYQQLIRLRTEHPALRSSNFFPDNTINQAGYGVFPDIGVVIYYRYGQTSAGFERFVIALNYSDSNQTVDIPFPINAPWQELLNGGTQTVQNYVLPNVQVNSNWDKIYFNVS